MGKSYHLRDCASIRALGRRRPGCASRRADRLTRRGRIGFLAGPGSGGSGRDAAGDTLGARGGGGAGGLRRDGGAAGHRASTRTPSGRPSPPIVRDLAPRNRALLDVRDRHAGADRRLAPRRTARRPTWPPIAASCARSAISSPEGPDFAVETSGVDPEIARDLRAAARGAGDRTRATRSTRPMRAGDRSTTRSTAPTPSRRTAAASAASGYNPVRGAAVIAWVRDVPRRRGAARRTRLGGGARLRGAGRRAGGDAGPGGRPAARGRSSSRATSATPRRRRQILLRNNGLRHRGR